MECSPACGNCKGSACTNSDKLIVADDEDYDFDGTLLFIIFALTIKTSWGNAESLKLHTLKKWHSGGSTYTTFLILSPNRIP